MEPVFFKRREHHPFLPDTPLVLPRQPPPGPKFSQFHAVFWKCWQNCTLEPPGVLVPPPMRNPGFYPATPQAGIFLTTKGDCDPPYHQLTILYCDRQIDLIEMVKNIKKYDKKNNSITFSLLKIVNKTYHN